MTIPRFAATSILVAICLVSRSLAGQRHPLPQSLDAQRARGTFEIVSCSLGCAAGVSGISCSIKQVHVNEVLRLTFNRPIDPGSVNNNSFRLIDSTGRTPAGSFSLDRLDPRTLVYRPQLTFDSAGNPMFGLEFGRVYLLSVPGTNVDPLGPYITSEDGLPNRLRMQCSLVASLGVADAAPGRPAAKLSVRVVSERDPVTGAQPFRYRKPLMPGEVIDVVLRVPTNPKMSSNQLQQPQKRPTLRQQHPQLPTRRRQHRNPRLSL